MKSIVACWVASGVLLFFGLFPSSKLEDRTQIVLTAFGLAFLILGTLREILFELRRQRSAQKPAQGEADS